MLRASTLSSSRGMTLVEIIVVIVLISLVFGIVARGVIGKGDTAKAKLNVVKMETLKNAIESYRFQYNSYPSSLNDLMSASPDVQKSGQIFTPLAKEEDLKDIWGVPYTYKTENNNRTYSLTSLGSDGVAGGEGAKQDVTLRP